ncbi:MAG: DUF4276 family protein [Trueperaceae bacterium]
MSQADGARVNIIVEGQTEREFVREILGKVLSYKQVYVAARAVETSRDNRTGKIYRGGLFSYERSRRDIIRWLHQDKNAFVTTMFDLYALPKDFPGYQEAISYSDLYNRVEFIEQALESDINHSRFIPYIQLHEFEALLFSNVDAICNVCGLNERNKNTLQVIRSSFATPEHINDNPQTAPSKRILSVHPSYEKITDGVRIAETIGLDHLRRECLHFHHWLEKLESLASS